MSETQKDLILRLLRKYPAVCATELLHLRIPRYAARILELRQAGYMIDSEPCDNPQHSHRSRQIQYVLIPDVHEGQLTFEEVS